MSNFPTDLEIGDAPHVFQLSIPFVDASDFSVVPVSESGFLTFVPPAAHFNAGNLNRFISVQATNLFHNVNSPSYEVVTFQIVGSSGILGTISARSIGISKSTFFL